MSKQTQNRVQFLHTLPPMWTRVFIAFWLLVFVTPVATSIYSITRPDVQPAYAAAPSTLNFQARLLGANGAIVADGNYHVEFKLYTASSGGTAVWTETRTTGNLVPVKAGYLSTQLGSVTTFPGTVDWTQQHWLTMNIGGSAGAAAWDGEMTPRIQLTAVPFAFAAAQAARALTLEKNTGSFTGTVDFATLTADRKYLFPDTSLATTGSPGTICVYNGAASNCPASSGSAYYIQNDTVVQTQSNFNIQARDSTTNGTVAGVLRGAAGGQTVDLLQFQATNGSVLAAVTAAGNLQVASSIDTRSAGTLSIGNSTATAVSIGSSGVTTTINGLLVTTQAATFSSTLGVTGLTTLSGGLTVTNAGNVAFQKGTDFSTTGSSDDVSFGTGVLFRLTGASAQTITGIAGGADGRLITLVNAASQAATISNNSVSSLAANRITTGTGGDISISVGGSIDLIYDSTAALWRVTGGTATNGGAANQQLSNLSGTVAINQSLTPNADNTLDLGSNANSWRTVYADTSVLTAVVDTPAAGTLNIGNANATTINMGANAGNHTINIGTSATGTQIVSLGSNANSSELFLGAGSGGALFDVNGALAVDFDGIYSIGNQVGGNFFTIDSATGAATFTSGSQLVANGVASYFDQGITLGAAGSTAYTTPLGASLPTRINIPNYNVPAFGSIISFGLPSGSASTARGILVADARTVTHQATIGVLSPDETDIFGFSWEGVNSTAYLKTLSGAIGLRTGTTDIATFATTVINLNQSTEVLGSLTVKTTPSPSSDDRIILSVTAGGAAGFNGTITNADLTAARTWTLPNESGTFCMQGSTNCGFAPTTGGTGYIQNQNAGAQATSNYWISGSGRADTSFLSPLYDTATAATLTIGGTATAISIADDTTIAAGKFLRITGDNTAGRPASPAEGTLFFDTDTKQLLIYANGKWQADKSEAILVAANNSSQADKDAADYVADGDNVAGGGTIDGDQVQINNALDRADPASAISGARKSGKVYLFAGTYVADATILIKNNTTLMGAGQGTVIQLADLDASDNLIENSDTTTGTNISIRDLRLDGRNDLNTAGNQYGIYLNGMGGGSGSTARQGARISDVTAYRFRLEGMYLTATRHTQVTNSTVYASGGSNGILVTSSHYNSFTGNLIQGITGTGILINSGSTHNSFVNNTIQGATGPGFAVSTSTENTFTGNTINGGGYGLFLSTTSSNNTITGNTIKSPTTAGISIGVGSTGNTVTGNVVANSGGTGIDADANSTTVTGNTVTTSAGSGIFVGADNITVSGNTVTTTATYGIYANAANTSVINGNKITDSGGSTNNYGIYVFTSDSITITDNNITDSSGTTTNIAIQIANSTSDSNYIAGNTLGTGSIADSGTGTIYGGQLNASGNYVIDPSGTVELQSNTNITGTLGVSALATLSGGLTVTNGGNVAFQRNITDYATTGTQDNINFGTGALFRITSATALTISGIAGGADGRIITLMNASANAVTISNSGSGTAANHVVTGTGGALSVPAGSSVKLVYDSSSNVWRVVGGIATAGGSANQQLSNLSGTVAINLALNPGTDNTLDLGSSANSWRTLYADTSVLTPLVDTAAAGVLSIGTTNATSISLLKNTTITGNLTFAEGAARTIGVATRTTNAIGNNLTISAGTAGTGGAAFAGGTLTLQGGGAAGTGNANGGAVTIIGGAGVGTGTQGLVNLSTTAFTSSAVQTYTVAGVNTVTAGLVDQYSTIPVLATTTTGIIVSVPDPAQSTVIGRVLYLSARNGSLDFTLRLNASGTPIDIAMKANSTATLIWNGDDWTAAGASSSTDLQSAYNNTLTSAGGAEIILNASGGSADGFTIRNNGSTPISGGILEVQSSIGTNLFSVNNLGTELAANGGSETSTTFTTNWTAAPAGGTVARNTTVGQYVTGQAGAQVVTTTTANTGIRNNLSGNPVNTIGAKYQVSFVAKSSLSGTPIDVQYSRDGGTTLTACTDYGAAGAQNLSNTVWTKITCTITIASATAATDPDLIIRKTDGSTAPTIYIDNLSFIRNDTTTTPSNVQVGGGINGGTVTLFTLDRSSAPPVANGDTTYLGSMYYDTTTGRIQCYESDGWGACGSAPDNIISLTPEYAGAVLNGTGVGTMTADFCSNESAVLVVGTLCANHEVRNFYRWNSPQATTQTYSIYVTYKLPTTFKEFNDANTMKLTALTSDTTLASASLQVFRKNVVGNVITSCGSATTINSSNNTWQQTNFSGDETACGFTGGDNVIFKIDVAARSNANVYVENLDFTYTNR